MSQDSPTIDSFLSGLTRAFRANQPEAPVTPAKFFNHFTNIRADNPDEKLFSLEDIERHLAITGAPSSSVPFAIRRPAADQQATTLSERTSLSHDQEIQKLTLKVQDLTMQLTHERAVVAERDADIAAVVRQRDEEASRFPSAPQCQPIHIAHSSAPRASLNALAGRRDTLSFLAHPLSDIPLSREQSKANEQVRAIVIPTAPSPFGGTSALFEAQRSELTNIILYIEALKIYLQRGREILLSAGFSAEQADAECIHNIISSWPISPHSNNKAMAGLWNRSCHKDQQFQSHEDFLSAVFNTLVKSFNQHHMTNLWTRGLQQVNNFGDLRLVQAELTTLAGTIGLYNAAAAPSDESLALTITSTLQASLVTQIRDHIRRHNDPQVTLGSLQLVHIQQAIESLGLDHEELLAQNPGAAANLSSWSTARSQITSSNPQVAKPSGSRRSGGPAGHPQAPQGHPGAGISRSSAPVRPQISPFFAFNSAGTTSPPGLRCCLTCLKDGKVLEKVDHKYHGQPLGQGHNYFACRQGHKDRDLALTQHHERLQTSPEVAVQLFFRPTLPRADSVVHISAPRVLPVTSPPQSRSGPPVAFGHLGGPPSFASIFSVTDDTAGTVFSGHLPPVVRGADGQSYHLVPVGQSQPVGGPAPGWGQLYASGSTAPPSLTGPAGFCSSGPSGCGPATTDSAVVQQSPGNGPAPRR